MSAIFFLEPEPPWTDLPERLRAQGALVGLAHGPLAFGGPLPDELGEFDALVTLPPAAELEPLAELEPGAWVERFRRWVEEPFVLFQAWLRARLDRDAPGRFVAVTSHLGLRPFPSGGAVGTGAAALHTIVRVAALEYAARGLVANALALGWHERTFPAGLGADGADLARTDTPTGRFTSDAELAGAVAWLVSEAPEQLNGQVLALDGGYTIARGSAAAPSLAAAEWLLEDEWRA